MPKWQIVFYPPGDERHSPVDALYAIPSMSDAANIKAKIEQIGAHEVKDWPSLSVKMINKLYQARAGDYRIYFGLDGQKIVVCHICRKVSQKAKQSDLNLAQSNFKDYMENKP